jgi:hypothetical protein
MVAVPMRRDHVINLLKLCVFHRVDDTSGIPRRRWPGITCIDEQGFPRRRNKECGISAFNVDDIDIQRPRSLCLSAGEDAGEDQRQETD